LDTMVTVVDCSQFEHLTSTTKRLKDVGWESTPQDERTLADLLIDQIEFADVILLNKIDLVLSEEKLQKIERTVRALNPKAKLYPTSRCENVPLDVLLNSNSFDMEEASKRAGWKQELLFPHRPETLEYGISNFTFREKSGGRGFDAKRISLLFFPPTNENDLFTRFGVLRSKGFFFVCQDDRIVLEWASAGPNYACKTAGFWNAAVDNDDGSKPNDRKIEIVFIGIDLKAKELQHELEQCLQDPGFGRNPTMEGLGEHLYEQAGFHYLYELMGNERRFDHPLHTLRKEKTRIDIVRARLETLSNLTRELTTDEISEAKLLSKEFKHLRGDRDVQ